MGGGAVVSVDNEALMEAKKRFRPRRLLVCRIGLDGGTAAEASRGRWFRQKLGGRPKITGRRRTLVQTLASSASAAGCRGMLRGYPKKTVDTGIGNVCGAPWTAAACCSSGESGIACPPSLQRRRAASPTALAREKPHKTLGCPPRSRLHWGKRQQAARSPRTPSQARFKSA